MPATSPSPSQKNNHAHQPKQKEPSYLGGKNLKVIIATNQGRESNSSPWILFTLELLFWNFFHRVGAQPCGPQHRISVLTKTFLRYEAKRESESELEATRETVRESVISSPLKRMRNKLFTITIQYLHHLFVRNVTARALLKRYSNLLGLCQYSRRFIPIHDLDKGIPKFCALSIWGSNSVAPNTDPQILDTNGKVVCVYPNRQNDLRNSSTICRQFWFMVKNCETYKMAS